MVETLLNQTSAAISQKVLWLRDWDVCLLVFLFRNKRLHFSNVGGITFCSYLLSYPNSRNLGCVVNFANDSSYDFDGSRSLSVPVFLACKTWEIIASMHILLFPSGENCLTLCLCRPELEHQGTAMNHRLNNKNIFYD